MAARRLAQGARRAYCTQPYGYCEVPMSSAYPCAAAKRVPTDPQNATGVQLPNKSRVVVQDNGEATALIGLFADAGAVYEPKAQAGVSQFLMHMLLKSNLQSSDFHMFKTFQHAAASAYTGQVGKRYVGAKIECRRDVVPEMMARLCEGAFVPRFASHEINYVREVLENAYATKHHDAKQYSFDQFVNVAFAGSPLANSTLCPPANVDTITHTNVIDWWARHFTPERMVLAGINVSQEELTSAYDKAEWSTANSSENPSHSGVEAPSAIGGGAVYYGGFTEEFMKRSETFAKQQYYNDVYVHYGRKAPGSASVKDFAAVLVAAGSVGPELNANEFGAQGVRATFEQGSVVGGMVRVRPEDAAEAVKQMAATVNAVGSLSGSTLETAKKVATINFLQSVQTRDGLLDFLVENSTPTGVGRTAPAVVQAISEITANDMKKLHDVMQSAQPTYTAFGDLSTVPSIRAL